MSEVKRVGIVGLGRWAIRWRGICAPSGPRRAATMSRRRRGPRPSGRHCHRASPRALAAASDFVIVVVGFDSEAEPVLLGDDGIAAGAHQSLTVGIASTIAPSTMRRLGARLAGSGLALLDMPLTRGEWAAEAAQLLVMVGGDEAVFARCRPAIACFADAIYHLGALGAGQVGKMVTISSSGPASRRTTRG